MTEPVRRFAQLAVVVLVPLSTGLVGAEAPRPLEPSDTSSPRATLNSFVGACNELYGLAKTDKAADEDAARFLPASERILDCLDLSGLPPELRDSVGNESAVYLKEVLDRIELPPDAEVPGPEDLAAGPEGAPLLRWRIPHTRLAIARIQDGPQSGEYLFSQETVRSASRFYSAVKHLPYRTEGRQVTPGFRDLYVAATKRQPTLSADTSSPRGTLTLFVDSMNEMYEIIRTEKDLSRTDPKYLPKVMRILGCLDLSELPEYSRDYYSVEAAVCLKEVLDRVPIPPAEEIPGSESIEGVAGEKLARWQIPNTEVTIGLVQEGPRRGEYLFTPGTVSRAVQLYEKMKPTPYRTTGRAVSAGFHDWWLSAPATPAMAAVVDRLPDSFHRRALGLAVWQWIGLALAAVIALVLMLLFYYLERVRSERLREQSVLRYWATLVFPILAMLVPLGFKYLVFEHLTVRGNALYVVAFAADLALLLALMVLVLQTSSRIGDSAVVLRRSRPHGVNAYLIRIVFRVLGIIAAVVILLEGGNYLGLPLTTLLASAGIGGLAIALASQTMLKGLFGTVTVLVDKPYQAGERIIVKGRDGFVEEIGMRATKLRLLTGHLLSIPNDQMADNEIENVGRRHHIRRLADIRIPLDTPREKVEKAVEVIRAKLDSHEGMDPDFPPRVYFFDFGPECFTIRVLYWFSPPNYWDFLAFSEKLNFEIFRAFEDHGIPFSLPTRVSYWATDSEQKPLEVSVVDGQPGRQAGPKAAAGGEPDEPAVRL